MTPSARIRALTINECLLHEDQLVQSKAEALYLELVGIIELQKSRERCKTALIRWVTFDERSAPKPAIT